MRKVQAWRSLSLPASSVAAKGLSKLLAANGDMSSKQPTVNELVETNRFEYLHIMMINLVPSCTCVISNYILTLIFAVIYPDGAMVCMTCSGDFGIGKQKQQ